MSPLRVAVVGCGYWGPNLVRNFAATPGVVVSYICDPLEERLQAVARRFPVGAATRSYAEVLKSAEVDAIALATPPATHRDLGEAALRAGKHLWIEKPLATSVADAEALVALAAREGLCLLVDHTYVYTPAVQKIAELVRAGELGELAYFDSVRVNLGLFQSDANVLWDLGPHDLSIARHVFAARPREVSAVGARHLPAANVNMAYVTLRYDDNFLAHFHFNWLAPVKVRLIMIGGSRRMIVFDDLEATEKLKIYDQGVDADLTQVESRHHTLISYRIGDMHSPRLLQQEGLAVAAKDFAEAIAHGRAPLADGQAGLEVVRILAAAQRSLERGGAFEAI